jgi:hypothetical protein
MTVVKLLLEKYAIFVQQQFDDSDGQRTRLSTRRHCRLDSGAALKVTITIVL